MVQAAARPRPSSPRRTLHPQHPATELALRPAGTTPVVRHSAQRSAAHPGKLCPCECSRDTRLIVSDDAEPLLDVASPQSSGLGNSRISMGFTSSTPRRQEPASPLSMLPPASPSPSPFPGPYRSQQYATPESTPGGGHSFVPDSPGSSVYGLSSSYVPSPSLSNRRGAAPRWRSHEPATEALLPLFQAADAAAALSAIARNAHGRPQDPVAGLPERQQQAVSPEALQWLASCLHWCNSFRSFQ